MSGAATRVPAMLLLCHAHVNLWYAALMRVVTSWQAAFISGRCLEEGRHCSRLEHISGHFGGGDQLTGVCTAYYTDIYMLLPDRFAHHQGRLWDSGTCNCGRD